MTTTGPPVQARESADEERLVGDYRLLALIGEGGMGVVHLARGLDGRRVALKVLRPYVVGDREARERLAREVASLRLVHSRRVAEVLDADPHGPTPYVATRYVPGLSLHEHVREEGPLAGADLLHFARCLVEALEAVHAVGVLHRDVKPSNVLMEGRSPVLIDFGLARLAEDSRLTHTGWLLGTPGYLAPEILYGDDACPASDVHAWAATVTYAATGRPPYGKGPAMAVMDRVRRGEHDLSGLPGPLAGLLRRALAPEPQDRPTLAELDAELARQERGAGPSDLVVPAGLPDDGWTRPLVARLRPPPTVVRPDSGSDPHPDARLEPGGFDPDPFDQLATTDLGVPVGTGGPGAAGAHDAPADDAAPYTRMLQRDPLPPGLEPLVPASSPTHRGQRLAQLVGLGAVLSAALAAAPYLTVLVGGLLVLALRAGSIGRERHARRREVRGRARWYDAPTTLLATPGYLLLSLVGSLLGVAWAVASAVAFGVLVSIAHPPLPVAMLGLGVVFTLSLWWGPGSQRLREVVGGTVRRTSRREVAGLVVTGLCAVAALALVAIVLAGGPDWSPGTRAPWSDGILAAVARHL